jgi:O-acetylhomoserine (thiol)-lyase
MSNQEYRFDTLAVRGGYAPDPVFHAVSVPIYQTTAYEFESVQHATELFELKRSGYIYSRMHNPTVDALEKRVAALDGGIGAVAMSSGHGVMFAALMNLAEAGDEIVSSIAIYGGAINLMGVTLERIGIKVKFVDPDDLSAWEAAVTDKTKAFFVEAVGNPNANIADLSAIAKIAHRHGVPFIVDSTFTTPYLIRPIEFGADIVIHSATKFLSGSGSSLCGIAVDAGTFEFAGNPRFSRYNAPDASYHGAVFAKDFGRAAFSTRLRVLMLRDLGACLSPFNAYLVLTGIETLSLRMRRHADNAQAVAEYLAQNEHVAFVNYPGLPTDRSHARMKKYMPLGAGAVFTFGLKGDRATGARFIDGLKLLMNVANVGDTRSLVIHPATTTHSQLTDEQLVQSGITPQTIRLSIGIEDPRDIIADLDAAIRGAVR